MDQGQFANPIPTSPSSPGVPTVISSSSAPISSSTVPQQPTIPAAVPNTTSQTIRGIEVVFAGFGRRLLAVLIDGVIISLVMQIYGFLAFTAGGVVRSETLTPIIYILILLFGWLIFVAYFVYFIGSRGQTLGKMALKIKVIKADTQQVPGYLNAFLREVVGKLLSASILLLGYFWMLWDKRKQTWHDKISNTLVIKI